MHCSSPTDLNCPLASKDSRSSVLSALVEVKIMNVVNTDNSAIHARLRRWAKGLMQSVPTQKDAIVVASFGRAGSTLVYDALVDAMAKAHFGTRADIAIRATRDEAFDRPPTSFRRGVVYKTHDYPNILEGSGNVRAIFLFGSALDAALSAYAQKELRGEEWIKSHFDHLRRPYRHDALLSEDVLGFRDQCIAWMAFEKAPVLCLRYEGLWNSAEKISEFCGVSVELPERRPRAPKEIAPDVLEAAKAVYDPLDRDLEKLPDCFIANKRYASQLRGSSLSEI